MLTFHASTDASVHVNVDVEDKCEWTLSVFSLRVQKHVLSAENNFTRMHRIVTVLPL